MGVETFLHCYVATQFVWLAIDLCLLPCIYTCIYTLKGQVVQYSEPGKDGIRGRDLVKLSMLPGPPNVGASTHLDLPRAGLILGVADGAILLDDHGPAAGPVAHAGLPSIVLAELGLGVAHEVDLFVLVHAVDASPGAHDEGIVGGNDDDEVHALLEQLVKVVDIGRDLKVMGRRVSNVWDSTKGSTHHFTDMVG
jgi:hypothetical protein